MHHVAATSATVADKIANDVRFKDTLLVGPPQPRPRTNLSNDAFTPPAYDQMHQADERLQTQARVSTTQVVGPLSSFARLIEGGYVQIGSAPTRTAIQYVSTSDRT